MELKIEVECDFKLSKLCKKTYTVGKYRINYNRLKNNGKYRCKFCAIEFTHSGSKSHYYKYYKIDHDFFENINSEIKSYLMGVIAGDGSITANQIGIVANSKDLETLELFQKLIAIDVPIKNKKESNCKSIVFTSKKNVDNLCSHLHINPGKKSDKISLPKLNDNLMSHFIRGLMDTDGCIDNPHTSKSSPRCFYSSTSKLILNEIKELMASKNINSYISGIKLFFVGKNAIMFLNYIYANSHFSLSRKRDFFLIWNTWVPYNGTSVNPSKRFIKRISKKNEY